MRKVIAAINMTLDGYCDHTAITPDAEVHLHYAELLRSADLLLYGRITYQLMQFWQELAKHPSGDRSMDDFAVVMDSTPKLVFSRTLTAVDWHSATLATHPIDVEIQQRKPQPGKDIFVGCRSLILQLLKLGLLDELQLMIHPVIAGGGSPLFEKSNGRTELKLIKTKIFSGGAATLYYEPNKNVASKP